MADFDWAAKNNLISVFAPLDVCGAAGWRGGPAYGLLCAFAAARRRRLRRHAAERRRGVLRGLCAGRWCCSGADRLASARVGAGGPREARSRASKRTRPRACAKRSGLSESLSRRCGVVPNDSGAASCVSGGNHVWKPGLSRLERRHAFLVAWREPRWCFAARSGSRARPKARDRSASGGERNTWCSRSGAECCRRDLSWRSGWEWRGGPNGESAAFGGGRRQSLPQT